MLRHELLGDKLPELAEADHADFEPPARLVAAPAHLSARGHDSGGGSRVGRAELVYSILQCCQRPFTAVVAATRDDGMFLKIIIVALASIEPFWDPVLYANPEVCQSYPGLVAT